MFYLHTFSLSPVWNSGRQYDYITLYIIFQDNQTKVIHPYIPKIISYLLTPQSRVLLEKLTGFQLVQKFPAFYGPRRFITSFTSARHLSLSWASSIKYIPPHPTSWRSILILSSHLRLGLPSGLSPPQVSPPKPCTRFSSPQHALHAPSISFILILSIAKYRVSSTEH